jgi:hypothetical protein
MATEKVDCTRCGTQILPATAEKNGGVCRPCKLGNKPLAPKTPVRKIARSYSLIKQFVTGVALTGAGGGLCVFFLHNAFTGVLGGTWFFRYIYSPIFALLCLLFLVAGVALALSASKQFRKRT